MLKFYLNSELPEWSPIKPRLDGEHALVDKTNVCCGYFGHMTKIATTHINVTTQNYFSGAFLVW